MLASRVTEAMSPASQTAISLRARFAPRSLFARQAALARRVGINDVRFVLSFDCDTEKDIAAAPAVHARLLQMDVQPVYAVPGELLIRGAEVYGSFHESGSEFLNHGGREHTYFDERLGRHASCFFYDQIGPARVREDVAYGHSLVSEVIGVTPAGFRAPHFGTYQRPEDLGHLHSLLGELGYAFSTSTVPAWGLRYGPAFSRFGLVEFPVTGAPSMPLEILDTWSCFAAPDRVKAPESFLTEAETLAERLSAEGAGVINIYGDPSHIVGHDEFFDAVRALRAVARPVGYADLLSAVK